jgi:hypothetical protein
MPPIPLLAWDDARSIRQGELQIARIQIGQSLFLDTYAGCRSTEVQDQMLKSFAPADLSRVLGRLFHILNAEEKATAGTSSLNVPVAQKLCAKILHPGRFLLHVFAFAVQKPVVREILQLLVRF